MAGLHCLNVRNQGPRQEDAKYLKPKPAEVVAISAGTQSEGAGSEGEVVQGAPTYMPLPQRPYKD